MSIEVISNGYGSGKTYIYKKENFYYNKETNLKPEKEKYLDALKKSKQFLINNKTEFNQFLFDIQYHILTDPFVNEMILNNIDHNNLNALDSINNSYNFFIKKLENKNEYFKNRIDDITSIKNLLINYLNTEIKSFPKFKSNTILVVEEILPVDLFQIDFKYVRGIITKKLSQYSHVAILLSSYNIPIINYDINNIEENKYYLIDTYSKKVLRKIDKDISDQKVELKKYNFDFKNYELLVNLNSLRQIKILHQQNINQIGLVRSELLFSTIDIPTFEEQVFVYEKVLNSFDDVTIRTFDYQVDKHPNLLKRFNETNTYLVEQLKALYSINKSFTLIFPMIEDLSLFDEKVMEVLKSRKDIKIGLTLESVKGIKNLDYLLKHFDTLSIGTNDLKCSVHNIDRTEANLADLCIDKELKEILKISRENNIEPTICGLMASSPKEVEKLLNFGYKKFSSELSSVSKIYQIIKERDEIESIWFINCRCWA